MNITELVAVVLSLVYVILAIRKDRLCWVFEVLSALAYVPTFLLSKLYLESALQLVFAVAGLLGWLWWRKPDDTEELAVTTLPLRIHLFGIVGIGALSFFLGKVLGTYTDASFPMVDSAITLFSVAATLMQGRKLLENWIYWIVIDVVAMGLYAVKGLYLTMGLYGVFVVLATIGYREWSRSSI